MYPGNRIAQESEFRARRYCGLLGHIELEIVAKNRSTVVWSWIPFKRFKGNQVNPRCGFNREFIFRHMRSFEIIAGTNPGRCCSYDYLGRFRLTSEPCD